MLFYSPSVSIQKLSQSVTSDKKNITDSWNFVVFVFLIACALDHSAHSAHADHNVLSIKPADFAKVL